MTDYMNPDKLYPDDISRRIDIPPGNDSIRYTPANVCVTCGQEMSEGDQVCVACREAADRQLVQGCRYCRWIDPALARDAKDDEGEWNYCRHCGRKLSEVRNE